MSIVLLIARVVLFVVFLVAGIAKLADLAGSRAALRDFGVPARLAEAFGLLLPLAELAVAVALLLPATAWWGALGALALLLLFVGGIGSNLARGRRPDCHCFGQLHSAPAGWPTLLRNPSSARTNGWTMEAAVPVAAAEAHAAGRVGPTRPDHAGAIRRAKQGLKHCDTMATERG